MRQLPEIQPIDEWGVARRACHLIIDSPSMPSIAHTPICIDIETDEQDNCVGLALYSGDRYVFYFTRLDEPLKEWLKDKKLVGHNLKADARWLKQWGVDIKAENLYYDTMLASYVANSTRESHGLKDLAKDILQISRPDYKTLVGKGRSKQTLDKHPVSLVANYCGCDVLDTYELYKHFKAVLTENQKRYLNEIELPTMRLLYEMEQLGVLVDVQLLRKLDVDFEVEISRLLQTLRLYARKPQSEDGAEFNANAPKQVAELLLQANGIDVTSTGKEVLQEYEMVPLVKILLRYRELSKLRGTYTTPLIKLSESSRDGRIRCQFNQVHYERSDDNWAGIRTGRLSSSTPNLHNISVRTETGCLLRRCFIAREGLKLIVADYSQIEWRLEAHLSKDKRMIDVLNRGEDIYSVIAERAGKSRQDTKTALLAANFGAQGPRIAYVLNIPVKEGYKFLEAYQDSFPEFFLWRRRIEQCETVTTLFGREIKPESDNLKVPYLIQGSAADILKIAMLKCKAAGLMPILNVHDELLFEIYAGDWSDYPESVAEVKRIMESVIQLDVPLLAKVRVGDNWYEGKA